MGIAFSHLHAILDASQARYAVGCTCMAAPRRFAGGAVINSPICLGRRTHLQSGDPDAGNAAQVVKYHPLGNSGLMDHSQILPNAKNY